MPSPATPSQRAARAFTSRVMAAASQGGAPEEVLAYLKPQIHEAIASDVGREMLRALVGNFLRGQAPHFAADAETVFALEETVLTGKPAIPLPETPGDKAPRLAR